MIPKITMATLGLLTRAVNMSSVVNRDNMEPDVYNNAAYDANKDIWWLALPTELFEAVTPPTGIPFANRGSATSEPTPGESTSTPTGSADPVLGLENARKIEGQHGSAGAHQHQHKCCAICRGVQHLPRWNNRRRPTDGRMRSHPTVGETDTQRSTVQGETATSLDSTS